MAFRRSCLLLALLGCSSDPGLEIVSRVVPDGVVGQGYVAVLYAWGGEGDLTWSTSTLPAGLRLDEFWITGTPTEPGEFEVTIVASDSTSIAKETISVRIHAVDTPIPIPESGTCDHPLELGVSYGAEILLDRNPTHAPMPIPGCEPESGLLETAYHFTVAEPSMMLIGRPDYENNRLAVYRNGCATEPVRDCLLPGRGSERIPLEAGEYVLLHALGPGASPLRLVFSKRPENETCESADLRSFLQDRFTWTAQTDFAAPAEDPFSSCGGSAGTYVQFDLPSRSWLDVDGYGLELFAGTCEERSSVSCEDGCIGPLEAGPYILRSTYSYQNTVSRVEGPIPPTNDRPSQATVLGTGDLIRAYRGYDAYYSMQIPEHQDLAVQAVSPWITGLTVDRDQYQFETGQYRRIPNVTGEVQIRAPAAGTVCDDVPDVSNAFTVKLVDKGPAVSCLDSPHYAIDLGQELTLTSSIGTGSATGACERGRLGSTYLLTVESAGYLTAHSERAIATLHRTCDFSNDACWSSNGSLPVSAGEYVIRVESPDSTVPDLSTTLVRLSPF